MLDRAFFHYTKFTTIKNKIIFVLHFLSPVIKMRLVVDHVVLWNKNRIGIVIAPSLAIFFVVKLHCIIPVHCYVYVFITMHIEFLLWVILDRVNTGIFWCFGNPHYFCHVQDLCLKRRPIKPPVSTQQSSLKAR